MKELNRGEKLQTQSLNTLTEAMTINRNAVKLFNQTKQESDNLIEQTYEAFERADEIDYKPDSVKYHIISIWN